MLTCADHGTAIEAKAHCPDPTRMTVQRFETRSAAHFPHTHRSVMLAYSKRGPIGTEGIEVEGRHVHSSVTADSRRVARCGLKDGAVPNPFLGAIAADPVEAVALEGANVNAAIWSN